jgi:hypothetical protein
LDGTLIAVGLPWDGTVFIQEYWSQGIPHYAIANVSNETAEVAVAEWHGVVGRRLMGPWTVAPNTVQCWEIKDLVTGYSGSLIAVSLNTNPIYGLLRAPKPLSGPIDWDKLEGILTIEGLNGTGDRNANIRCWQPQLVFDPGQTISLKLQIPENIGTLFFEQTRPPGRLPQATVTGVTSNTLSVEVRDGSFVVVVQQMPGPAIHEIALAVKIPEVEVETMAAFFGRVASHSGAGFYFGRGLIVRVP